MSGTSTLVSTPRRCDSRAIERASLLTSAGGLDSVFAGVLSGVGVVGSCSIGEF